MVTRRTRRTRGGLFSGLKARVAKTGLFDTPEYQSLSAIGKDSRKAWNSAPASVARQTLGMSPPTTGYPNPYGRSASVAQPVPVATPVPMARPVPVATPVPMARPVPTAAPTTLSPQESDLVSHFLWAYDSGIPYFQNSLAPRIADAAVSIKNKERNLALLSGIGELAKEVKALHDEGVPQSVSRETLKHPGVAKDFNEFEEFESLTDPAVRERVARALASAQDPPQKPGERRYLPGTINQVASAVRSAFQKKLLLGGKTRRNRRRGAKKTLRRRL